MSTLGDRNDGANRAPKKPSESFVVPPRKSRAIEIKSPLLTNSKQSRTPSPKNQKTQPRKKAGHDALNSAAPVPRISAPSSEEIFPFGASHTTRPPGSHEACDDAVAIATQTPSPSPLNPAKVNGSCGPLSLASNAAENTPLDIYAPSYVPLWLRAVNESIAVPRLCASLRTINFPEYISTFAGHQHLQPLATVNLPAIRHVRVVQSFSPDSLSVENYVAYFWEALQNEVSAQQVQLRCYNIFAAPFQLQDPLQQLFRVTIPGIREDSPRVNLGDVVLVRPLFPRPDAPELTNAWVAPGGGREKGLCAPGFAGLEYNAIVWGIARTKEEVLLRVDGLTQLSCNIIFAVQEHRITPLARSVTTTAELLRTSQSAAVKSNWLSRMLFPTPSDGVAQLTLSKGTFPDMTWLDPQLNYEQQKAVSAILHSSYGSVPYLVSGPPGTGKTKTIVETTLQFLKAPKHLAGGQGNFQPAPHILLCAPSDPAADTLASRLARHLMPTELFRLNGWSRAFPEVPGYLLPYSYVENDLFSLPSFEVLMSYKVVVTTCHDADMLVQARLTNDALSHLARSTIRAVAPAATTAINESQLLHWTALLLDEAAQATEPDALIPLMVVAPSLESQAAIQALSSLPQVVMAGDEYQLGPRLCSGSSSALSTSLFARLFSRAFYAQHPLSRQKGSGRLLASMLPMNRPAFTNLIRNYRSHPSILSVPSQLFYNDTLIPESTSLSDIVRTWPGWMSPRSWPVLFVQNATVDTSESILSGDGTGAGALYNHGEALIALQLVQRLLGHRAPNYEASEQIKQAEVVVMSPFEAQVHVLRNVFREQGLYDVNIGPLEAFQGLESRIVVLCTTRTRRGTEENAARFVKADRERGLGVIGHPKRFNVAITRAKEGLIVLGDAKTLIVEGDPCWKNFVSFCARNGCLVPDGKEPSDLGWLGEFDKQDGVKEGRLEKALVFAADLKTREATRNERKGFGYPESQQTRRQKRISLKGQILSTDDEMWRTGLQMAETMHESMLLEDEKADQGADTGQAEEADPWNCDRYPTTKNEDLSGQASRTDSPVKASPVLTTVKLKEDDAVKNRVFSSESAKEFDRDPRAEFEKMDCATQ
jgi:helicase MOV-10